jgi:predicted membrane-bound dolichyl-phosphate-mannose-protein mannosyltransferase
MTLAGLGSPAGLLAGLFASISAVIGLYIGYQAYRGLRRNRERSMRWLSVGMILLFGLTYLLAVAGQGLFAFRILPIHLQNVFRLAVRLTQVVGLGCIAYSLRIATNR